MWIETNSGWFQSPSSQREAKTTFISPNYQLRLERRHWRHGLAPFHLWGRDLGTKLRGRVWATRVGRAPGPLTLLLLLFIHSITMFSLLFRISRYCTRIEKVIALCHGALTRCTALCRALHTALLTGKVRCYHHISSEGWDPEELPEAQVHISQCQSSE